MDFTNNSQETTSFDMVTMAKVFQDGVEIDMAFDVSNLGDSSSKEIRSGATIEVTIGLIISKIGYYIDIKYILTNLQDTE